MKKLMIAIIGMFTALSTYAQQNRYDFYEPNHKGDTIYYQYITYDTNNICVVRPPKPLYTDTLFIPATVKHNGRTYTVTEIGGGAYDWIVEPGPYSGIHNTFSHVVIPETVW